MNDSKRLYNKFTTLFWWGIATLPFLMFFMQLLMSIFNKNYSWSMNPYSNMIADIQDIYNNIYDNSGILYNKIVDMFDSLFIIFGLQDNGTGFVDFISYTLSWFIFVHLLHIIVDTILILPNICQKFLRKVRD